MSTLGLDAIRDLFARYADATWDEDDGLARDLAVEVPALLAEVERLRQLHTDAVDGSLSQGWERTAAEMERDARVPDVQRLSAMLSAARVAYVDLARREIQHAGSGRDGHLDVRDLDALRHALAGTTPGQRCQGCEGYGARWQYDVFDLCGQCQPMEWAVASTGDGTGDTDG